MDGLLNFFNAESGQRRRASLDQFGRDIGYYVPPELRSLLGFVADMAPTATLERAGQATQRAIDPSRTGRERIGDVGAMLSETAAMAAPVAVAGRAAIPAARAAQEGLLGFSSGAQNVSGAIGDVAPSIRAFHGSPHDFDRFDMSKIGTGEGAQAYGSGLYFAENEAVARMYRDQLAGGNTSAARRALESAEGDVDQAIIQTRQRVDRLNERASAGDFGGDERRFAAQRQIQEDKLQQLLSFKETGSFDPGRMYEVNIRANPEDFLDYDAPLSAQPRAEAAVGRYLESALDQPGPIDERIFQMFERGEMTGADVARLIGQDVDPLLKEGIPGIRYLDAGSRGVGEGSRNLVVFDDNLIDIVRKYGIAGAAALLGLSVADVEAAMAAPAPQGLLAQ
jgi:hypothetical protein